MTVPHLQRCQPHSAAAHWPRRTMTVHVKTFHKYSCWFFVFLGFFFKYCLLLCLKEKKKYPQKKREIRPQPGPSDRCSASLLRHKALSGAEESQRGLKTCLDAFLLPSEVFQAPSATQIAKDFQQQGRWYLPSIINHVTAVLRTQVTAFVWLQKMPPGHRTGPLPVQAAALSTQKLLLHVQLCHELPWWPWASQSRFLTEQKQCRYSFSFPQVWSVL